jgi:O-antigen/teichoic acid export membrane protein
VLTSPHHARHSERRRGAPGLSAPDERDPRTVFRNTVFSGIGEASNVLLFVLGFLAPRYLAPDSFGAFRTAFAFIQIFRILPDLGMAYASTLDVSRTPSLASRVGSTLLGFQLALSAATVGLCLFVARLLYGGSDERLVLLVVLILSLDLVLKTVKGTLRFLLKGLQRFGVEAASLVIERTALLTFGLLALRSGYGAWGYALVFLVVRLPDTLGLWAYVDRFVVRLRPIVDLPEWRGLLTKGLPFGYAGVMVGLLFLADNLILEKLAGHAATGYYGIPLQILEGASLVPRIVSYALLPTLAALWARAPREVVGVYRRGLKYLLLVGLPIAVFGVLASPAFIPAVFGGGYAESVPLSEILIPVAVLMFVSNFSETTLFCIDRSRTLVVLSTIALVVDVGLAFLLIPRFGARGAAVARVAGEGLYTLLTAGAVSRAGLGPGWATLLLRPGACALAFGLVLAALAPWGLLPGAIAASLAWGLGTLAFGVWDAKERELMRGLLTRRKEGS